MPLANANQASTTAVDVVCTHESKVFNNANDKRCLV
jgi:hypothetical protein